MRMRLLKHISVLTVMFGYWSVTSGHWTKYDFLLIDDVSDLLLGEVGGEVGEVRLVAKLS